MRRAEVTSRSVTFATPRTGTDAPASYRATVGSTSEYRRDIDAEFELMLEEGFRSETSPRRFDNADELRRYLEE